MKKLNLKQKILVAMTLFGMFFGAGNLIFPVQLGQLSGRNFVLATIGFIITAVGIPILGVAAIGNTHSDGLQTLASKVSKPYGIFFTLLLYLTIGPFFAIPRCATTSFTVGVAPILEANGGNTNNLPLLIFAFIFFAIVLVLSLKPGKITLWIGKVINPIFLIIFLFLVFTVLFKTGVSPFSIEPEGNYVDYAFSTSIIDGYNTMDAIAGLAFGIVVIDIIRRMGVNEDGAIAKDVVSSGIITGILMALIYVLTIIIGAQSRGEGLFEIADNGGILLGQLSNRFLGGFGSILFAIAITFACLKTSIGLVTSCAEMFVKMFPKFLNYKIWVCILSVFSFIVSGLGLSLIIEYSIPVLMFIYPLAITIIILALLEKTFEKDKIVYLTVTVFTLIPAIIDFIVNLPFENVVSTAVKEFATKYIPLFKLGLGWVIPAFIGFGIGYLIHFLKKKKA